VDAGHELGRQELDVLAVLRLRLGPGDLGLRRHGPLRRLRLQRRDLLARPFSPRGGGRSSVAILPMTLAGSGSARRSTIVPPRRWISSTTASVSDSGNWPARSTPEAGSS